jgi:hypothetical protein
MIIADKGTFFDSGDQTGLDNSTTALQKPKQHPKKETLSMSISQDRPVFFNGSNLLSAAEFESTFLFPHPLWRVSAAHRACVQNRKRDLNRTRTGYTKTIRNE